jgi:hypothetical protein
MILPHWTYRNKAEEGEDLPGDGEEGKDAGKEVETAEPEVAPELVAEATRMGWTPKDQFKGDPAKWRPADEFVERGRTMLPILRHQVQKQDRQIAELTKTVREFAEYQTKTEQRATEKALLQLRQERADAIAKGDGVAFDKVDSQIIEMQEAVKAKPAPQKQDDDPAFTDWLSKNKWAEDPKLQHIGKGIAEALVADGETARGPALLDMVSAEIKKRYPEKFDNPRRAAAPAVEGGAGPRKSAGKSYADLPADARAACDRMARNGFGDKPKEMAEFKAQYVKNYFEA